jgi:hypothetical protein
MNQSAFRMVYSVLFPAMVIFAIALHQNSIFGIRIRGPSDKYCLCRSGTGTISF